MAETETHHFAPNDLGTLQDVSEKVEEVAAVARARVVVEVWDATDSRPVAWIEVHPDDSDPTIRFTPPAPESATPSPVVAEAPGMATMSDGSEPRKSSFIDGTDLIDSLLDEPREDVAVVEVLTDHMWNGCTNPACDPGGAVDEIPRPFVHHLAEALAPLIAERVRAAAVEALREAAADLNTTDHATETALMGIDHVIDWLRDRADRRAER